MRQPAIAASATPFRRARTLAVALSVLIAGAVLYANNVRAEVDFPQSTPHPRVSLGISTLAVTAAPASAGGEIAGAGQHARPAATAIAWTSPWGSSPRPQRQSFIR